MEALQKLAAVFSKPLSKQGFSEYFEALKTFDIDSIEKACVSFRNTAARFPLPVDFRHELSSHIRPVDPPGMTWDEATNTDGFKDWRKRCASKCTRCDREISLKGLIYCEWRGDKIICPRCVKKEKNVSV